MHYSYSLIILFSHDFFGNELDNEMSKCHEEREKYQNYFEGLHKLADMRDMIEDINSGLAELDKHVQSNINDITKRQGIFLDFGSFNFLLIIINPDEDFDGKNSLKYILPSLNFRHFIQASHFIKIINQRIILTSFL